MRTVRVWREPDTLPACMDGKGTRRPWHMRSSHAPHRRGRGDRQQRAGSGSNEDSSPRESRARKGPGGHPSPCRWWWDGSRSQTALKVRDASPAGWRELLRKQANPPYRARTFKRFCCRTGCQYRQINSAEGTVSSIPICGIEPASAQVAVRRKGRSITAQCAANNLHLRRIRLIISA